MNGFPHLGYQVAITKQVRYSKFLSKINPWLQAKVTTAWNCEQNTVIYRAEALAFALLVHDLIYTPGYFML